MFNVLEGGGGWGALMRGARWLAVARGVGAGMQGRLQCRRAAAVGSAPSLRYAQPVRSVPLASSPPPWLRLRALRFRSVAPPPCAWLGARVSAAGACSSRFGGFRRPRRRPAARRRPALRRRSLPPSSLRARLAARRALARSTTLARFAPLRSVATPPPSALPPLQAALHPCPHPPSHRQPPRPRPPARRCPARPTLPLPPSAARRCRRCRPPDAAASPVRWPWLLPTLPTPPPRRRCQRHGQRHG